MKHWHNWTVILALVAYVILFWWWASFGYPTEAKICNPPGGADNCESHNILFTLVWYALYELNFYGVIITAIATGFIARFTYTLKKSTDNLWGVTQGAVAAAVNANKISSDNLEFTHRARISILDVFINHKRAEGKIQLRFKLKNIGTFAATRIMVSFADTMGPEWTAPTREALQIAPQIEAKGLIIQSQESTIQYRELNAPLPEYFERARKETFYLRFGIIVVYLDGFDKPRTTWKWFEWSPESDKYRECAARQD